MLIIIPEKDSEKKSHHLLPSATQHKTPTCKRKHAHTCKRTHVHTCKRTHVHTFSYTAPSFAPTFTNFSIAKAILSLLCAALICTLMRAFPRGTTG